MSRGNEFTNLKAGRHAYGRAESATANVADPQLRQLQASLGNDEMRQQVDQGRADRSLMLAHVTDRLNIMHELQGREIGALDRGAQWDWWRDAAKSGQGATMEHMTTPDPNRWHEAAAAYKEALLVLSRGDIGNGRQKLEHAMEIEDRTMERFTEIVGLENLEDATRPDSGFLDGLVEVGQVEPCDVPESVQTADQILTTIVDVPEIPRLRAPKKPWWAEDEEEEEEDAPPGDGDASGA